MISCASGRKRACDATTLPEMVQISTTGWFARIGLPPGITDWLLKVAGTAVHLSGHRMRQHGVARVPEES